MLLMSLYFSATLSWSEPATLDWPNNNAQALGLVLPSPEDRTDILENELTLVTTRLHTQQASVALSHIERELNKMSGPAQTLLAQTLLLAKGKALLALNEPGQALWYVEDVFDWAQQNGNMMLALDSLYTLSVIERSLGLVQSAKGKSEMAQQYADEFRLTTHLNQLKLFFQDLPVTRNLTNNPNDIQVLLKDLNQTRQAQLTDVQNQYQLLKIQDSNLRTGFTLIAILATLMSMFSLLVAYRLFNTRRQLICLRHNMEKIDLLTQFTTRHHILLQLSVNVNKAKTHQTKVCIAKIKLNQFKTINQTFGCEMGDRVLACLGRIARNEFPSQVLMGRTGSNDFLFIFQDMSIAQTRKILADFSYQTNCIGDSIGCEHVYGQPLRTSCSIGVAQYVCGDSDATLLARAEQALDDAIQTGCGQIVLKQLVTSRY